VDAASGDLRGNSMACLALNQVELMSYYGKMADDLKTVKMPGYWCPCDSSYLKSLLFDDEFDYYVQRHGAADLVVSPTDGIVGVAMSGVHCFRKATFEVKLEEGK